MARNPHVAVVNLASTDWVFDVMPQDASSASDRSSSCTSPAHQVFRGLLPAFFFLLLWDMPAFAATPLELGGYFEYGRVDESADGQVDLVRNHVLYEEVDWESAYHGFNVRRQFTKENGWRWENIPMTTALSTLWPNGTLLVRSYPPDVVTIPMNVDMAGAPQQGVYGYYLRSPQIDYYYFKVDLVEAGNDNKKRLFCSADTYQSDPYGLASGACVPQSYRFRDDSGISFVYFSSNYHEAISTIYPSVDYSSTYQKWESVSYSARRTSLAILHERSGESYFVDRQPGLIVGRIYAIHLPDGGVISYNYGSQGLASVTYPDGSEKRYAYDGANRLTEVREIKDNTEHVVAAWSYDGNGKIISSRYGEASNPHRPISIVHHADESKTITDADGVASVHTFDTIAGSLRLTGASHPCNGCSPYQSIEYADYGLPIRLTDHAGVVTEIERDESEPFKRERKRVVGVGTPEARTVETTWHSNFFLPTEIKVSEPGGGSFTRTMAYDGKGRVTLSKLTQTLSTVEGSPVSVERTTTTTYVDHPNGQAETVTVNGPREDVDDTTIYRYDSAGRLLSVTNPQGQVTSYSDYDVNGRARTITHPNGVVTQLVYDWKGRLLSRTTDGVAQHLTYHPNGLLKTRSTLGHPAQITTYAYDAAQRPIRVTDPLGNRTETDYDAKGRVKEVRTYDAAGTLRTQTRTDTTNAGRKSVTYTPGSFNDRTTVELDPMYRLDKLTDPMGRSMDYTRDAHGRPVRADHSSGLIQTIAFDAADNILASNAFTGTPQRDRGSAYAGDADGGMHQTYRADTGLDDYELDGAANVVAARNRPGHLGEGAPANADGPASTTEYDTLNRPVRLSVKAPDGSEAAHVEYAYDVHTDGALPAPTGRLTRIAGSYGSTDLNYDARGNLVRLRDVREGIDATQAYAYDNAGRLTLQTYPSGREVEYTLDARGLPAAVRTRAHGIAPDVDVATAIQYTPAGALANWTRSDGRASPATYDLAGRLKTYDDGARTVIVTYHPDGRVWDLGGGGSYLAHYEYDDSGRLSLGTGIFGTSGAYIEYGYDRTGDLASMKRGDRVDFAYHARSSMLDSAGNGALVHTYGPRGVITADGINFNTLNYDERGLMAAAVTATGTYAYAYDAAGRRVAKTLPGGQRIHYHYDAQNRLIAESQNGVWLREYLWLGERPVMMIVPGAAELRYDIHVDYANTPVRLTDAGGATVWQWSRSPFGSEPAQGPVTFNLRMPGQYRDAETGYHYNMARYYDPRTGRYLQPDPAGEAGGISAYTYADGDPVNRVDPDGRLDVQSGGWTERGTLLGTVSVTASPVNPFGPKSFDARGFEGGGSGFSRGGGFGAVGPKPSGNLGSIQTQNRPCGGVAGAIQGITGGESDQSFVDDVVNNFVNTTSFGISDVGNGLGIDFGSFSGINPGIDTATSIALGGLVARTYGGITPLKAIGQAWSASNSTVQTPGLIGFRTVPSLVATSGATWAINAVLIKGMYNSGVLAGSVLRTTANRAATSSCGK